MQAARAWALRAGRLGCCRRARAAVLTSLAPPACSPLPSNLQVLIDGVLRVPYSSMLRVNQVRPELQVVDPGDA